MRNVRQIGLSSTTSIRTSGSVHHLTTMTRGVRRVVAPKQLRGEAKKTFRGVQDDPAATLRERVARPAIRSMIRLAVNSVMLAALASSSFVTWSSTPSETSRPIAGASLASTLPRRSAPIPRRARHARRYTDPDIRHSPSARCEAGADTCRAAPASPDGSR